MRFDTAVLLLFLLCNRQGTWSFVPCTFQTTRQEQATRIQASSTPLDQPLPQWREKKRFYKKKKRTKNTREIVDRSIPSDALCMSEVFQSATLDDFKKPKTNHDKQAKNGNYKNMQKQQGVSLSNNATLHSDASKSTALPWKASYYTSRKTQQRIQSASHRRGSRTQRAIYVLDTFLKQPPHLCNPANLVCALTTSAKLVGSSGGDGAASSSMSQLLQPRLTRVLNILYELVQEENALTGRQLCNSLWAIAKFYNRDSTLLPQPPQATFAQNLWGIEETWTLQDESKSQQRISATVNTIAQLLTEMLTYQKKKKLKVGEVCMASWAIGVLRPRQVPTGWSVPPRMGRLPKTTKRRKRNSDTITYESWTKNDNMVEHRGGNDVSDELLDAVGEYLCDGAGAAGNNDTTVMIQTCTWNEIANVAWAYATHGHCQTASSEKVMQTMAQEGIHRLAVSDSNQKMLSRDVAQLVWALGTLQSDNYRLGDSLVNLLEALELHYLINSSRKDDRPFESWSSADLVQLAISMAHGRVNQLSLLNAVYEEAHHRLLQQDDSMISPKHHDHRFQFCSWEISVLLWAQARLYLRSEEGEVFGKFCATATNTLLHLLQDEKTLSAIGIGPQEQANIAWSLTVLDHVESPNAIKLLNSIFTEAAHASETNRSIQLEHAHQLWQALYLLEEASPMAVQNVPTWFREFLQEKWRFEKSRQKLSSHRHKSLSQTLKFMGVAHYNEHDEDIDVAIVLRDDSRWTYAAQKSDHRDAKVKVAVEFDGPNHFTRIDKRQPRQSSPPPRTLGHTVLKYRLLKRQGWTVVRVPFYEFDKIPFWASMERQRYLQRLLKTHANIKFSDIDVSEYKALTPNRSSRFD